MRVLCYYRSTDISLVEALRADVLDCAMVEAEGQKFADLFGAKAMFTRGLDMHFVGVTFKGQPHYHTDLWSKASDNNPLQVPLPLVRVSSKNQQRAELLRRQWEEQWPHAAAAERESRLLKELFVPREELGPDQALHFEEFDGHVYLMSTLRLADRCSKVEEIMGTMYERAMMAKAGFGFVPVPAEEALAALAAQKEREQGNG